MTGGAHAVRLYYADLRALTDAVVAEWVTSADRERLTPAMRERRRTEYLAGRALLRYALSRHVGRDAASLRIEVAADGKPECANGPAISISHSARVVACAVAGNDSALGIDVEATEPRDLDAIARRFFTPAEARWIDEDPLARFRMLWVLKEAYLKALGVGIGGGLDSLECRIEPPAIVARAASKPAPQLALLAGRGCYLGVATTDDAPLALAVEHWAPLAHADEIGPFTLVART